MAFVANAPPHISCTTGRQHNNLLNSSSEPRIAKPLGIRIGCRIPVGRKSLVAMASTPVQSLELVPTASKNVDIPIMVTFELS